MVKFAGALIVASILVAPALAQFCNKDSIESVTQDGSIIVMASGAVYSVDVADQNTTLRWQPMDEVLICNNGTEMINPYKSGDHANVARMR